MAVDLYVGTLTRYYAAQWENVGQRMAREQNMTYSMMRPSETDDVIRDSNVIAQTVYKWRSDFETVLSRNGTSAALSWSEDKSQPYFTDRIGWNPLIGVILWACYLELGRSPPKELPVNLEEEPALSTCASDPRKYGLYAFLDAELWIPCELLFQARTPLLSGKVTNVTSTASLSHALGKINAGTWRANPIDYQQWRETEFEAGSSLESNAKFGFSVLRTLTDKAQAYRLPMVLDF